MPVGDKGQLLEKLVRDGLVVRERSVAVGDTISDASMLVLADHPIMFNPSQTLLNRGAKDHWPRVNEVKDQITALMYDADYGGYVEQANASFMRGLSR